MQSVFPNSLQLVDRKTRGPVRHAESVFAVVCVCSVETVMPFVGACESLMLSLCLQLSVRHKQNAPKQNAHSPFWHLCKL